MALSRVDKEKIIEKIKQAVLVAGSAVFVNFHGLTVAEATQLRRELRAAGASFLVAKKTLISRALAASGVAGDAPELPGEVAIAFGPDPLLPAKTIHRFSQGQDKERPVIQILGGVYEQRFSPAEEMRALALVPGRTELYGLLANLLNAPLTGLARALGEVAKSKV